jgi:hypothetical protein
VTAWLTLFQNGRLKMTRPSLIYFGLLRKVMKERGVSFKKALNEAVKAGLSPAARKGVKPLCRRPIRLDSIKIIRWDKAQAIADALEDEELLRKMALRK